jgi:hypothetical protein
MRQSAAPPVIPPWARCCLTISPPPTPPSSAFHPGRAVANDEHTLYLIAEAGDEEQMSQLLGPFAQVGSVELLPASSCEVVINRGGCAQVLA